MDLVILNQPRVYPYKGVYYTFKRIFDIFLCVILSPVIAPVLLICALLVCLDSSGPAFFVQERIGKDGVPFKMYKLRTMYHNVDRSEHRDFQKAFVNGQIADGGKVYKPVHASQITRMGRLLRKTSLDELPQILNVFKGEMSVIGPRPNVPWEVEEYKSWHYGRLEVLPGITGLAQVRGRSSISFDSIVKYDIEYAQNLNLWLDVKILWWTVNSVLLGTGAK